MYQTKYNFPFQIDDLKVFDDAAWQNLLVGLPVEELAISLKEADRQLVDKVLKNLPSDKIEQFYRIYLSSASEREIEAACSYTLEKLFWELTYWKTPELYETLTEGEKLHPGIFQKLEPDLYGKIVLDAGAGSGRASLECLRYGAKQVYAVEPSRGLINILNSKLGQHKKDGRLIIRQGRFQQIPLAENSVDLTMACSAFTAEPEQGGEKGLDELIRVTRPKGKVVIIWPRQEDLHWLSERGFRHVSLPLLQEMKVKYRSLYSALRCAKLFYQHNPAVEEYLLKNGKPEVPFSVIGVNPPHDYCWLEV